MRTPTPLRVLALCATAALAVTGCTAKHASGPTPTYYESWSPEQEAEAVQGAEQAIRDYWRAHTQCMVDPPNTDPSCFDQVSTDDWLSTNRATLKDAQGTGYHYVGEIAYVGTEKVLYVDLSVGPNKEIRLVGCSDSTSFDVIMADGTSGIPPGGPVRTSALYVMRKHAGEWQVADISDDPEGDECRIS